MDLVEREMRAEVRRALDCLRGQVRVRMVLDLVRAVAVVDAPVRRVPVAPLEQHGVGAERVVSGVDARERHGAHVWWHTFEPTTTSSRVSARAASHEARNRSDSP